MTSRSSMALRLLGALSLCLSGCGAGGDETPQETPAQSFAALNEDVFLKSCSLSSCHAAATESGGLKFSTDGSYGELVGIPSEQLPSINRVEPGDPDNSYLIWKLEGGDGIVSDPMPPPVGGLGEDQIAAVRAWIAAGAVND